MMSKPQMAASPERTTWWIMNWLSRYSFVAIFLVLIGISTSLSPAFLSVGNLSDILLQTSILGVVSIGATWVILTAGIDLSVGGVVALTGIVAALTSRGPHGDAVLAVVLALMTGLVVGCFNGVLTVMGRVPSFVVTLATGTIAGGVALSLTGGQPVYNIAPGLLALGSGSIGPVPLMGIIWLSISLIVAGILKYTPFGRYVYAIGDSVKAAYLAGLPTKVVMIAVFGISGLLAGLGGVLYTSWVTVGYPNAGSSLTLESIAAVVIGGTSLFGGVGGVGGTVLGALMLIIFTNIFNILGLGANLQIIGYGALILFAILLNQILQKNNHKQ